MSISLFKRIGILLFILVLLFSCMDLAFADLTGLDRVLSSWLEKEKAIHLSFSMELQTLLPFTQDQVAQMNAFLKHLVFHASLEWRGEDSITHLALTANQKDLFTLTERVSGASFLLETSLLPNRILQASEMPALERLTSMDANEDPVPSFELLSAIPELEDRCQALISSCEPFAERKRANYKIKSIGTAKWSQIARLTTEQSDAMLPLLRAVLQCGMDETYRSELDHVRFGKGFIVGLYKLSETDRDIAVYLKGDLLYPDGSKAKLTFQWAFLNNGTERTDTYQFDLSRSTKPSQARTISAMYAQKLFSDRLSIAGSCDLTVKSNGVTTLFTEQIDLSGQSLLADRTLEGVVSYQTKVTKGGQSTSFLAGITSDLAITQGDNGSALSGVITIENKQDKAVIFAMSLLLNKETAHGYYSSQWGQGLYNVIDNTPDDNTASPPSSLEMNSSEDPILNAPNSPLGNPEPPIGIFCYPIPNATAYLSVDNLSQSEYSNLMNELSQNFAISILKVLSTFPQEDLALFQDGMTGKDYLTLLSLLGIQ